MSKITDENYLHKLFIQEAAPALERHSGGSDVDMQEKTVDITENGTVEIVPDEGCVLSKVVANVEVSSGGSDSDSLLEAFIGGSLTDIESDIESIRQFAFYRCTSVKSVKFNKLKNLSDYALMEFTGLEMIDAPLIEKIGSSGMHKTSVKSLSFPMLYSIGASGLSYNAQLVSIDSPNLQFVSQLAFQNDTALTRVCFPKVDSLDTKTFYGCSSLSYADFTSIRYVGKEIFYNCSSLNTLVIRKSTRIDLSNINSFTNTPIAAGTGYIYVPAALVDSYKSATNWSNYASQFRALEDYTVDGTTTGELDETKI